MLPTYWTNYARISQSYQGACGRKKIAFVLVLVPVVFSSWYSRPHTIHLLLVMHNAYCALEVQL